MECREALTLVQQYIDDKLPPKKLEAFITHINQCSSCYEELEIYYIIHHAVKYLDEDRYVSYNVKEMLTEDLNRKTEQLNNKHKMKFVLIYIVSVFVILLIIFIIMLLFPDLAISGLYK